jgi:SAM-dependent methyltransferase
VVRATRRGIRPGVAGVAAVRSAARARERGVEVFQRVAEHLPFADDSFDDALVVTTLCFVDSPAAMLAEARRVLKSGGTLVIGFIDRDSPLGQAYQAYKAEGVFYREATFHSADEVERLLLEAGFAIQAWGQTLSRQLDQARDIEALREGRGACAFVVVQARNDKRDTPAPAATRHPE